jgi:hypothetical protein
MSQRSVCKRRPLLTLSLALGLGLFSALPVEAVSLLPQSVNAQGVNIGKAE